MACIRRFFSGHNSTRGKMDVRCGRCRDKNYLIECKCGCEVIARRVMRQEANKLVLSRPREFISGHTWRGRRALLFCRRTTKPVHGM